MTYVIGILLGISIVVYLDHRKAKKNPPKDEGSFGA